MHNPVSSGRRSILCRFALALTPALVACDSKPDGPIEWAALEIDTSTLIRVEPSANEQLRFHKDGTVSATFVQPDGLAVAPILYWRIQARKLILSESPAGTALMAMDDPRMEGGQLAALDTAGKVGKYKISRFF